MRRLWRACLLLAASGRSLQIYPSKEHGEGQSCVFFFLHPGFSSQARKLVRVSVTPLHSGFDSLHCLSAHVPRAHTRSSVIDCSHPRADSESCPNLLAFPAHHSNNSPRSSKNIVARATAIPQIRMFPCAGTIKDYTLINFLPNLFI